ncbi:MAG: PD-(D/E)XK nuclease family protein, partial [Clostridia bacterium]|nr:PD-(D/E)XK nuclease family protein [Clostridia bacterium]
QQNLFMVGDVKQGIYGFRNTVSELFTDKVEKYSKGECGKCVYLSDNFRSRDAVLDFANLIFSQLMSPALGGTPYTDTEALHKKGTFNDYEESAEVYVLTDELFKKDTVSAEALFCAAKIHEMIAEKMQVTGTDGNLKDISYGDIAILLRATKGIAVPFCETLSACGIPVYCDALSENFLDTLEIQSLISFLKAFSNPLQDTHLLSAFTSPIFGEPDYDLTVRIKLKDKNAPLYECMKKYPKTEEGYERVSAFLSFIDYWQKKSMHLTPARLISEFLTETGFSEYMEALKGGTQRLSNIRYLEGLADSSYPGAETGGLYSFLKYLDKHEKTKSGLASPKILPDSAELVQVTTIHKSKGLEYPVVIIPRTGHPMRTGGSGESILFHRDFGIGIPYRNVQKSLKLESPVYRLINNIRKSEELSEELRVLYVALTRAIDKTIVVGYPENIKSTKEYAALSDNFDELLLPEGVVSGGKSYLDWILCALNRENFITESTKIKLEYIGKIEIPEEMEDAHLSLTAKEPSEALCERLSYTYPYLSQSEVYSKVSVTELKSITTETDENAYKPFITKQSAVSFGDKKSALKTGTVTHYILENTDFSEHSVEKTVENMISSGKLTKEEADCANLECINRFLNSPLCDTLRQADKIYKELPFNIHIDASRLNEAAKGETVQLQGTIDCLAIFGDSILIVDFKTDNIDEKYLSDRIELYRPQLEYYKLGAEKLFPEKDISASIYFLAPEYEEKLF